MSAYALCPRNTAYKDSGKLLGKVGEDGGDVAVTETGQRKKVPKSNNRGQLCNQPLQYWKDDGEEVVYWKVDGEESAADGARAPALAPSSTLNHLAAVAEPLPSNPNHPHSHKPKRKPRRRNKMGGNNSEYIPPHLRKRPNGPPPAVPRLPSEPKGKKDLSGSKQNGAAANSEGSTKNQNDPGNNQNGTAMKQNSPKTPNAHKFQKGKPIDHDPLANAPNGNAPNDNVHDQGWTTVVARSKERPSSPPSSTPVQNNMEHRPMQYRTRGGPRAPRGQHRKTVWPKARDMKPLPDDESDGGVECKSESMGDPDYDVKKLMDWNGDWLPAPVEWSSRKPFTDRSPAQRVEEWATQIDAAYSGGDIRLLRPGAAPNYGTIYVNRYPYVGSWETGGELASRLWIPAKLEGESPQQFWRSFPSRAPAPLSDIDLNETKPWWETFPDENHCQLGKLEVPDAPMDPEDPGSKLPGAKTNVNETLRRKAAAAQERIRRTQERRNRPTNYAMTVAPSVIQGLKPAVNIYIRPVVTADAVHIAKLYNHYVKNSIISNEFVECAPAHIVNRINDCWRRGLPWIVAVKKGNGRATHQPAPCVTEEIVGFAALDDYVDVGSMFRFTTDLEMYVHPDFLHKGIGKCLMDRMLSIVDPVYSAKGGYDWVCRGEYLKSGCSRVIKVIQLSYPHANDDPRTVEWFTKFVKTFGFRKGGHLYGVGYKLGKCVDVSIFQYTTSENINASANPINPL